MSFALRSLKKCLFLTSTEFFQILIHPQIRHKPSFPLSFCLKSKYFRYFSRKRLAYFVLTIYITCGRISSTHYTILHNISECGKRHKKPRCMYDESQMAAAVQMVEEGGSSIMAAARHYGIPRATLWCRMKREHPCARLQTGKR